MRVAAIDCGTNSLRLLISEPSPGGGVRDVLRRTQVVRLGEGVDAGRALVPAAIERTLACLRSYVDDCRAAGVEHLRFVATSAARDAANGAEFLAAVGEALAPWHVTPEIISGDEEARLSFLGATAAVRAAGHPGPYLVVDLGGGSTEFVRGDAAVEAARSVDIGAVRLTERLLHSDPPSEDDVAGVRAATDAALDEVAHTVELGGVITLVGLAGTVTTLTAHLRGLPTYADERVHLAEVSVAETLEGCAALVAMPRAERERLPIMMPGRADVIAAGAIVWSTIVERVAAVSPCLHVVTSVHDILDGMVTDLVAGRGRASEERVVGERVVGESTAEEQVAAPESHPR